MTLAVINVGSAPNDGTGDVWRNAWIKAVSNFDQVFNGPMIMGPPTASGINLTINQAAFESDLIPGIFVKGSSGSGAAIALGANGTTPGLSSFDFQQDLNGNGYIIVRPTASLLFRTANANRIVISSVGGVTVVAPTAAVNGLTVNGNSVGGVTGALKCLSTDAIRIATFDCTQGTGGYIALERSGVDGFFIGNSGSSIVVGGSLDDYAIRTNNGMDFVTGSSGARRAYISSTGNFTMRTPTSGIPFLIDGGALDTGTNPALQVKGTAGFGSRISITGNGSSPSINSFDLIQVSTGDVYIVNRSNNNMAFWTNNLPAFLVDNAGKVFFSSRIGANGVTPPLQVVGFGVPTGTGVINNFNGAAATLPQCSQAIAQIITDLKNLGFYGA